MKTISSFIVMAALVCGLVGCGDKTTQTSDVVPTDSLEYSGEADSVLQCSLKVDFPSAKDSLSLAVADFIVAELQRNCLPTYMEDGNSDSMSKYAGNPTDGKAVIDFYGRLNHEWLRKEVAEFEEQAGVSVSSMLYSIAIRKIADNAKYLSYQTSTETYLGGAHGSSSVSVSNIIKPTGKVLEQTIDTLKLKEMQPMLRKGVLAYLNAGADNAVTDNTLNDILFIEDGVIPLPVTTPYLASDGLHFIYQQYEIGPYAMGIVTFTVPYAEAKPFMTPQAQALAE